MPYGEGYTNKQLRKIQRDYDKTDDGKTYKVVTADGARFTVQGINSAKAVAGKGGKYEVKKGK